MVEKTKKKYFMERVTFAILARIWDGDVFRGAIKMLESLEFVYIPLKCV